MAGAELSTLADVVKALHARPVSEAREPFYLASAEHWVAVRKELEATEACQTHGVLSGDSEFMNFLVLGVEIRISGPDEEIIEVDAAAPDQPPLTLTSRSYCRGSIDGKPCLVIYDEATDETTVVAPESKWYANAMAALDILEAAGTRLPPSALNPKTQTILHVERPRLIRAH